jgi:alkanesulfonate monooxygenase SsuD/methylene tetrahydromethanopterin reductase-like flavin-dependent oxidoreductase (luciferase family)
MQVGTALSVLAQAGRPDAALYHEHTALGDLAEPLGFDSLFALAHHFTGHLMSSARPATAGSLRGRMKRVALGTCVIVLPWHDSIRVTEQIALLDAHRHNIRRRKY